MIGYAEFNDNLFSKLNENPLIKEFIDDKVDPYVDKIKENKNDKQRDTN